MHGQTSPSLRKRILVVDDDQGIRRTVADYLVDSGFDIQDAADGNIALQSFSDTPPDIVLLDLHLPDIDGLSVLKDMVRLSPDTPVIIVSGAGVMKDAIMALRLGAWDYLTKPINDLSVLEHRIAIALDRAELKREQYLQEERLEQMVASRTLELRRVIDDHVRTAQAFQESEAKYRAIMERASDAILLFDSQGAILDANPRACELTGHAPGELMHMRWRDLFSPLEKDADRHACPTAEDGVPTEKRLRTSNGDLLLVEVNNARIDEDRSMSILRDLTQRRKSEAETARAAHLASIGELASGVAHEINNPLNAVINYSQLILDTLASNVSPDRHDGRDDSLNDMAGRLLEESGRIGTIVRSLLSFSRRDTEPPAPLSIPDMVRDSAALFHAQIKKDGSTFEIATSGEIPLCMAKPNEIRQVCVNLLSNARYALNRAYPSHSPDKRLSVLISHLPPEPGDPDFPAGGVRICFQDTGTGIPAEIMDRITQPFFTTKPPREGTGLGLSISKDIITRHGGRLHFDSVPGKGTSACVDLPVWNGEEMDHADTAAPPEPTGTDS